MASIINAATSGGLVTSADTSGVLQLQTASTTAVTVDASQNVSLAVGTANGVTYLNGSKVLTSGSALTFDGTTLGNTKNDVTGTTELLNITRNNSGTFIKLVRNAGSGNAGGLIGADSVGTYYAGSTTANMMYVDTANTNLQFYANSAEGMRLTSTGLGIGTSSPASKLQVTSANGAVTLDSGTGESHYIDITHKGSYSDLGGIRFNQGSTTYGNNQILFRAMDSGGTVQTVMTLNGAGNLGLGVTPSAWGGSIKALEGYSTSGSWSIASGGGLGSALNIQSNAYYDGSNWIYKSTSPAANYYQSAGAHVWRSAASGTAGNAISFTQAMSLLATGELLIGKTAVSNSTAGVTIWNYGGGAGTSTYVKTSSGQYTAAGFYYAGTNVGYIDYTNSATIYSTSSDIRLKKDIVNAPSASTKIDQIRIVSHGWKHDDEVVEFGTIAQELHTIAPQAVIKGDDNDLIEKTWAVDYSKLVPMLIKEVQELRQRVATLEAK